MTKILKVVLSDYKKANKERRLALLARFGYKNEKDFLKEFDESPVVDQTEQDMVIAFDTTGSMAPYLYNVKEHVKELIPKLFKTNPGLRLKIVAFGDYCDMVSPDLFGRAYQESKLTNNENDLIQFVIGAQPTSGGDSDEFYELVIKKITEETPWRQGKKSVLLIADFTPHELGYTHQNLHGRNQIDWRQEANAARVRNIQFDTLKILPQHTWYNELSKITGGVCLDFHSSNKMSNVVETMHYARSGTAGGAGAFTSSFTKAYSEGDSELVGSYKSMATLDSSLADIIKETESKSAFGSGTTSDSTVNKTKTK